MSVDNTVLRWNFTMAMMKEANATYHNLTNKEKVDLLLEQFEAVETAAEKKNIAQMKRELITLAAKCFVVWRGLR